MRDLISVIIPVCKVEEYLPKCVDSVLSQTYKNLEIFLVDDGSPDNCGKICDEYAKKDERVKVIHKENGGLSSARNAALDVCRGDYITFVDSDDWVEKTYVEELYKEIKKHNCDVSICLTKSIFGDSVKILNKIEKEIYYDAEHCYDLFFGKKQFRNNAWAKLYSKHIFEKLRYPVGCNYEDVYVIGDICNQSKKGMVVFNSALYNYRIQRDGAITNDISYKIFDWIRSRRHSVETVSKDLPVYKYCCATLFNNYYFLYKKIRGHKDLEEIFVRMFKEDLKRYSKKLCFKHRLKLFIFRRFKWLFMKIW